MSRIEERASETLTLRFFNSQLARCLRRTVCRDRAAGRGERLEQRQQPFDLRQFRFDIDVRLFEAALLKDSATESLGRTEVRVGLDAQRQELFAARYDVGHPTAPRMVEPFQLCAPSESGEVLRMDLLMSSPDGHSNSWIPDAETLAVLARQQR